MQPMLLCNHIIGVTVFMDMGHYNSFSIIELVIQLISDLYQHSRSWDTPNYCIFGL